MNIFLTIVMGAIAVVLITAILFQIIRVEHNRSRPVVAAAATVISKRQDVRRSSSAKGATQTLNLITFEREDGGRAEYAVSDADYGLLVEGDRGVLQTKGAWYRGFQPGAHLTVASESVSEVAATSAAIRP